MNNAPPATDKAAELRDFLAVLRRALLIIVRYIEKRYDLASDEH